jgi:hypothetical protein
MTATCSNRGETWPHDPALEVRSPTCHVPAGVKCRRPSGHRGELHASHDQAAMDAGFLRPCPKGRSAQMKLGTAPQLELF